MIDGQMFFNRSKLSIVFSHPIKREDKLFAAVYGCEDIKRLFRMALDSKDASSILLTGPPASAKTLFLQCLLKLKDSHFIDCSSASKSGIVDYVFKNNPKYLLLDELDKLSRKDQTFLLNLMESGIVSETKYNRTRKIEIRPSVFATSNNAEKIIEPFCEFSSKCAKDFLEHYLPSASRPFVMLFQFQPTPCHFYY
jgi:hypothetical protein